jgi:hypothetical protein
MDKIDFFDSNHIDMLKRIKKSWEEDEKYRLRLRLINNEYIEGKIFEVRNEFIHYESNGTKVQSLELYECSFLERRNYKKYNDSQDSKIFRIIHHSEILELVSIVSS